MMNFKSKVGFTLIEVLLALALVGLTIMPILNLQSTLFSSIERSSLHIEAALEARQFLFRSLFELDKISESPENPFFSTKYEKVGIKPISSLQNIENMMKVSTTVSWQRANHAQQVELLCFWFEKPKEESS